MSRRPLALSACAALAVPACVVPEPGPPPEALFVTLAAARSADTFYHLPFPSDLRRTAEGRLDLTGLPEPSPLLPRYRQAIEDHLDGFGLNAAMFARFSGPLDTTRLPDPAGTLEPAAPVYLVDVDPDSPGRGQRVPLVLAYRAEESSTIGADALIARPYPGFALDEGTTYALVITDRLGATASTVFSAARAAAPATDPEVVAIQAAYAPLWAYLDEPGGDERGTVVSAAVFTTQHATDVVPAVRAAIAAVPAPSATGLVLFADNPGYVVYDGSFDAPSFQRGLPPYDTEGDIVIGADGLAVVQRTETLRFAVAIPDGPVPLTGWPLAVYQHGTGGDYHSFVDDGTAARLASEGIASVSMDQVLHGPRNPGRSPDLDFFNFTNPLAARDNVVQGAADCFSLARLGLGLSVDDQGRTNTFDRDRLYYFGHSQGSTTGALYVAFADDLKAAVLSGSAGGLYLSLIHKTEPVDIPSAVSALLRDDPLDENTPSLAILQTWIERGDALNYGKFYARAPGPRSDGSGPLPPRNVLQTDGLVDTYSPNINIRALAVAIGGDQVTPVLEPIEGLALRQRTPVSAPVSANLAGATVAVAQYPQRQGSDGHFVVFDVPTAMIQAQRFLGSHARTGVATVEVP